MRCDFSKLKQRFKNPHVISWLLLSLTILYIFISILFEFQDWLIFIYAILIVPLLFGLSLILKEEIPKSNAMGIDVYDGFFALIGVILTYTLAHQLALSAVIASTVVGLLGYLMVKKYAVAIYCGSFAGMVSSFLFGYVEVLFIAVICGLLFIIFKPIFKGMGGKLGTTAFLSTMLVATILNKDFLIIDHQLSFLTLLIVSVIGTVSTFYLQHALKQSAVFASAIMSLTFALITIYLIDDYLSYEIVFFSASFVGMSAKNRLPNIIYVVLASIIHAFLYFVYFDHYNGLGGKLGLMALTTVLITIGVRALIRQLRLWTFARGGQG